MNMNITFKGMEPSDAIREYVTDRAAKLRKFLPPSTTLNAVFEKEKVRQIAEINFNFGGQAFTAKTDSEDIYASIDKVVEKVATQLRRSKDKKKSHGTGIPKEVPVVGEMDDDE